MVDRFTFQLEAKMPCPQSMAAQSSLRLWESSHLGKVVNGCSLCRRCVQTIEIKGTPTLESQETERLLLGLSRDYGNKQKRYTPEV